ncbi:MAG TPA: hypothetical protein VFR63_03425 [Gaiellaceae bacterium]|nr:hypothetical protein [Gaiellaceae bacterium]
MPFLFADVLAVPRDGFYAVYAVVVVAFVALWARSTGQSPVAMARRRLPLALALGAVFAGIVALIVLRTEDATARPDGLELVGAVVWRGLVYGFADGLLLSAFPILAVFAMFAGTRMRQRVAGTIAVGLVALLASLAMTAVYHAGYSQFRSEEMRKPLSGAVVWGAPTLLTLNPLGAPVVHMTMHTTAVLHSYETDTYLPPHE